MHFCLDHQILSSPTILILPFLYLKRFLVCSFDQMSVSEALFIQHVIEWFSFAMLLVSSDCRHRAIVMVPFQVVFERQQSGTAIRALPSPTGPRSPSLRLHVTTMRRSKFDCAYCSAAQISKLCWLQCIDLLRCLPSLAV